MERIVNETVKEEREWSFLQVDRESTTKVFSPSILKNVLPHMEIVQEEVLSTVAPIITVDDEKEAIKIANDSKFGLGSSIWMQDLDKAERLSDLTQSGMVIVNNVVASDPSVPFGGIKKSGFGRDLLYL